MAYPLTDLASADLEGRLLHTDGRIAHTGEWSEEPRVQQDVTVHCTTLQRTALPWGASGSLMEDPFLLPTLYRDGHLGPGNQPHQHRSHLYFRWPLLERFHMS